MAEYQLIFLRSLFSFLFLLIICRILGKQQISQLTFFDYIVGITIGSVAASLSVDQNIKISNGIASLIVWGFFPMILVFLSLKSHTFATLLAGKPTVLIENGKINEKNLKKMRITLDQLMLNLREQNAFKLSDVELALFETNGKVSVMKKSDNEPITPKILGMQLEKEKRPHLLIQDGVIIDKNIQSAGYTQEWLYGEVQKHGAKTFSDVFAAQIDSKGNLYVDLYDDKKPTETANARQIVSAQLNKIIADLHVYELGTENSEAKAMYHTQLQKVKDMVNALTPYLK
jgi:uncharacterized membrane protein YcaP (DUF421 family)